MVSIRRIRGTEYLIWKNYIKGEIDREPAVKIWSDCFRIYADDNIFIKSSFKISCKAMNCICLFKIKFQGLLMDKMNDFSGEKYFESFIIFLGLGSWMIESKAFLDSTWCMMFLEFHDMRDFQLFLGLNSIFQLRNEWFKRFLEKKILYCD